jgi:hypothetical protein
MTDEIEMGIYRHYKGPLYLVMGLAHDANAGELWKIKFENEVPLRTEILHERTVVVYMPLQLDGAHLGPRMAVRTLEDFTQRVCRVATHRFYGKPVGPAVDDCGGPRFEYLGPELTAEMITRIVHAEIADTGRTWCGAISNGDLATTYADITCGSCRNEIDRNT